METIGTVVQTIGLLVLSVGFAWATIGVIRDFARDIGFFGTLAAVLIFGGASIACGFGFLYYASQFGNLWLDHVQWINALYEHTSSLAERVRQAFERYVLWALLILIGTIISVFFGKISIIFWRDGLRRAALLLAAIPLFYIAFFIGPGIALFIDRIIGVEVGSFADTYLGIAERGNAVGLKLRDYIEYFQAFALLATAVGIALAGGTRLVEDRPGYRRYVGIGPISFLFVLLAAIIAGSTVYQDVKALVRHFF